MNNRVTLFTVSYNSSHEIEHLLSSLENFSHSFEVFIADNSAGSDAQLYKKAKQWKKKFQNSQIEIESMSGNLGYGAALNSLFNRHQPDQYFIISNPDLTILKFDVQQNMKLMEVDKKIGIIGPRIINDSGEIYPSARKFPRFFSGTGHAIFSLFRIKNRWTNKYLSSAHTSPTPLYAEWLSGAFLFISSDAFRKVNGFNEDFFMYFEDVDLAWRLNKIGIVSLFNPEMVVMHSGAHSTNNYKVEMITAHHTSASRFLSSYFNNWYQLPLRILITLGLEVRKSLLVISVKLHSRKQED